MARARTAAPSIASLLVLLAVAGCSDDVGDPSLGATAERRGNPIGVPVTGTVENPEGEITVTLAPQAPPGADSTDAAAVACDYADGAFSCPTDDLSRGPHRVEVTDAALAGEATEVITVVLTDDPGYDPRIGTTGEQFPGDRPGFGRFAVVLTGWEPGRPVVVYAQQAESGRTRPVATVTPDAAGQVRLRSPELEEDRTYAFLGDDGLWNDRSADGWSVDFRLLDLP